MTNNFSRSIIPVCAFAAIIGAASTSSASASEKERAEGHACPVTATKDGSKPAFLSDTEIRSKLEAAGYTEVRSLGREGGCVEAKGLDKNGKRFEVYLHPATGEIVSER